MPAIARFRSAAPYMLIYLLVPLLWLGATRGGLWVLLPPVYAWYMFTALDALLGLSEDNPDPDTPDAALWWYRLGVAGWVPVQAVTLFGLIAYATRADHLGGWELAGLFFGMGVASGTVGMVYAHELMHQKPAWERWLGDILLGMVCYGHFRSEHLLVHHRYVGTPRDAVSARYNEGFHRFFFRVLPESFLSAIRAERQMQARRSGGGRFANPFWRYGVLTVISALLVILLGGWLGLALFLFQSIVAIWQLELTNYVEHYGLTREHLGEGRYEHVKPRHSWNAAHTATNWLLINLQRHSDHHYKPDRRFPLLQTYDEADAPQLPYGYPLMTMAAMVPPVWRRVMNPRVRAWRRQYYPQITDWSAYKAGTTPLPKGS
ncbi:MAG: alkane 1-monooxygenase [Rhodobacterales bacterium]|nr:MAG: alkane 1-monooxygenase [Rhodobacterales bacterium]